VGHEVKYVNIPPEKQAEELKKHGVEPFWVETIVGLDAVKRNGHGANVVNTFYELTGLQPHKMKDWIKEHADELRRVEEKKSAPPGSAGSGDKMVLYHITETRSTRPAWAVYELGLEGKCEIKPTNWKYIKTKEYQAIDPNMRVPALAHGSLHVFEAGAIIDYLSRVAGSPLTPKDWSPEQWAHHNQYVFWCITTLDERLIQANFARVKALSGVKGWWASTARPVVLASLKGNEFIMGNTFSITDIYLGYSLYWANKLGLLKDKEDLPIASYFARLIARPAFKKAFGDVKSNM